jgi:folate-binding protein YgfZ
MLTPFKSTQSLILSPHGHIEHDLHAIDDGQTTWLIVEPNTAENLAKYLDSMKFMLRVEVKAVSDNYAVVGAPGWIETNFPTWHSPNAYVDFDNDPYVTKRPAQWKVTEYIVPKEQLSSELINPVGSWAWEAHRIRAGVARLNFETDHKTIPHEVGLIGPAVHLNKGCYRGQETIARVVNLGKPPRRLVHLELDGSTNELPKLGDEVTHDGQVVGRITSVVQDYESGPVALAVIKRNISPELVLTVNNISASQTPIVNI